jgi:integrase
MARVYRDKRTGKLIIDYLGVDGRRRREKTTATTKEEANALLRMKQSEITRATLLGVRSVDAIQPKTFSDFIEEEYLPHCKATHTATTYANSDQVRARILKPFFGAMLLRAVTSGDVQRYVDKRTTQPAFHRGRSVRPATINRELGFLSGIFSEAERRGYVERNPVRGIALLPERNDKLRWLTEEEEGRLLAYCPTFLRPIVLLAIHTGMRRGEILNLKRVDLNFKDGLIRVADTKNHKVRYIPMNVKAREILDQTPEVLGVPFVFVNPESGDRYVDTTHAFLRACRCAGITGLRFHDLRHTFASRLAQAGIPLNNIRELMGHGSMQMVLRYAHLSPNCLREAVAVLDRVENPAQLAQGWHKAAP